MIRESTISIKQLNQDKLNILSDACAIYQEYLKVLCNTENKSQHHIHHSINREYGYMLLSKLTRRKIPKSITIDVHTAFIAADGLSYYMDTTTDTWGKNAAMQFLDEVFQELPNTKDKKKYSLISEFKN